ncbi:porin [Roseateles sp.]|uniref:porin n=1 Tax=Roseateles sp. TaxID=1971397 RepID=UPI0031D7CE00
MNSRHLTLGSLTLSALACATAAQAQSNVTIYGTVDVSLRRATHYGASNQTYHSEGDAVFSPSRFGLRGSEDLGGGYKGVFLLEQGLDPSSGTLTMATATPNYGNGVASTGRAWGREAWVGLETPMGTVTLGRQYTLAHQLSGRFQPFPNPNLDAVSGFSVHHVARQDNMLKVRYGTGPVVVMASVTASEGNGKSWAAGGSYTDGPVDVATYYQSMDSFNGAETRRIFGIGGSYAITSTLKGMVGYMKRSQRVSVQENDVYSVGLNYQLTTAVTLMANYLQDRQSRLNPGKRHMAYLAVDYAFSKRTGVYAEVDTNELTGAYPATAFLSVRGQKQVGVSTGMRHRF